MEKSFNTLNIAFGINNKYSKYIRVITYSICVNNPQSIINFHILTDFISKRNISKIKKNIEQFKNAKIFMLGIQKCHGEYGLQTLIVHI